MAQGMLRSCKTRDGIAAMLADNIGYLEEDMYDIQQEWLAQHSAFDDMEDALEQAGLRVLNRPNLIKQNWWTNGTGVEHPVVYGKAARISGSSCPYMTNINGPTETTQTTAPTAEQKAAATSIYSVTEGGVTTYHIFTDTDSIKPTVAALASADQITETDGETYDRAINFDITANSAYGNTEWLLYYNPSTTRTYKQGNTFKDWGQVNEMVPGRRYSLSCWVRVLSGDGAWIRMGYGNSYSNQPYDDSTNHRSGISDWIKVEPLNGAWQRISWTFDFEPVGDWYTETSEQVTVNNETVTQITRTYNWFKKVGFGIGRKYTAVVQMCGFRLVEGRTFVCDTYDDLEDDVNDTKDRVTALETASAAVPGAIAAAKSAMLSIMAESDTATATAAHAVGELITVGDALYRVTSAIATGETIAAGTNVTATTLAAEIAAAKTYTDTAIANATQALIVDFGTLTARNYSGISYTVPGIDSSFRAIDIHLGAPSNVVGDLLLSTGNNKVSIHGVLSGSTSLKAYFVKFATTVSATEDVEEEIIE